MTTDHTIDWVTAQTMLLTDRGLRDSFRLHPETVARELKVGRSEVKWFVLLNPDQLEAQAHTLLQKRFHEVGKLLPGTFAALAEEAWGLFADYSTTYWPEGHRRHLLDAAQFAQHLH